MTNLILLVTVFVMLNGFVHSYPSWLLKQKTDSPKRSIGYNLCPKINHFERIYKPVSPNTTKDSGGLLQYEPCEEETFTEKLVSRGSDGGYQDGSDEVESVRNKKRENFESKLDLLNKIWRSPMIERQDLPKLFILRTNAYKK